MLINLKFIFPEIFLIISIFFLSFYGIYYSTLRTDKINFPILSMEFYFYIFLILLLYFFLNNSFDFLNILLFSNTIKITTGLFLLKKLNILIILVLLFISYSYLKYEQYNNFEYYLLYLFLMLSIVLLLYANDFMTLYLSIEFQNFIFYILLAYNIKTKPALESAIKYFILASLMSIFMVYGISLLYGITGTFNFNDLKIFFIVFQQYSSLIYEFNIILYIYIFISILFIFILFFFKLTIAPFYFWALDVYEGTSIVNLMLFMIISKFIFLIILIKIVYIYFFKIFYIYQNLFFILAFISIIIGAFGGISETNIKKIFAYSSINHIGFILLSLSTGTFEGVQIALFYFFIYIIMSFLFFIIFLSNKKVLENRYVEYITDFKDYQKINKILAYVFAILLFSLSSIPPLLGFWGKFFVLIEISKLNLYILLIILLTLNMLNVYYYLRFVKIMFFDFNNKWNIVSTISYSQAFFALNITMVLIFGFYFLDVLLNLSYKIIITLF